MEAQESEHKGVACLGEQAPVNELKIESVWVIWMMKPIDYVSYGLIPASSKGSLEDKSAHWNALPST